MLILVPGEKSKRPDNTLIIPFRIVIGCGMYHVCSISIGQGMSHGHGPVVGMGMNNSIVGKVK